MKKVYVVNGAAHSGFGEATARELIRVGNRVIGLYTQEDAENAEALTKEFTDDKLSMIPFSYNHNSILDAVSTINEKIDGFINAHFVFDMEDVENFDYALAERLFFANYHAPMMMAVELKKKMRQGACVVIVTSTEAERGSFGGISYAAAKAAVHNMVKSLACNWGKRDKIRVNAVAAGWIGGEMDTDGPFEVSMDITPLGRLGRAEEVAGTVCFLLSDAAGFINAQTIIVDGGYLCVDDIAKYEYEESQNKNS